MTAWRLPDEYEPGFKTQIAVIHIPRQNSRQRSVFLNKPQPAAIHVLAAIKKATGDAGAALIKKQPGAIHALSRSLLNSETLLGWMASGIRSLNQNCSAIMGLYRRHPPWMARVGEWLSLVEHLVR